MDGVAKVLELCDEPFGLGGFAPAVEVIGPEILVQGSVCEHVIDGGED